MATVVTVAITLTFSYFALRNISLTRAWQTLAASNYVWLIPALAALALATVTRALRWRSLFAPGRRPPRGAVLNATIIGYFYNSILPTRAGEAARVVVLTKQSGTPAVEVVGTAMLERLFDIVGILVIFFVAIPWLPHVAWVTAAVVTAIVLAILIALAASLLALFGDRPVRLLLHPLKRVSFLSDARIDQATHELVRGLSGLRDARVAGEAILWTIAAWLLSALCAYIVTLCLRLEVSIACGVLIAVVIGIGMILPSPPAAVGVFEAAALIALRAYHVPHAAALSCALMLHLVNWVPFLVAGLFLLHQNVRTTSEPRMARVTDAT